MTVHAGPPRQVSERSEPLSLTLRVCVVVVVVIAVISGVPRNLGVWIVQNSSENARANGDQLLYGTCEGVALGLSGPDHEDGSVSHPTENRCIRGREKRRCVQQ